MKIAIEAQRIFRKNKHGMDFVILELIRKLQRIDLSNQYYIFVAPGEDHCLGETPNFHIIELKCCCYPVWEQWLLPYAVKKLHPDLLHCSSNTAPLFLSHSIPLVLTLHDIIFFEKKRGENRSRYQRWGGIYRRLIVRKVISKCKLIITVSHYEAARIKSCTGLSGDCIKVIYNGVESRFRLLDKKQEEVSVSYIRQRTFLFFLGNTDPKKNTVCTLEAYSIYVKQSSHPLHLLVADLEEAILDDYLKKYDIEFIKPYLHAPGYIPNKDLPAIYNSAFAFLYPSLRESFGIPVLEAMACGTPVITSNAAALPEVAGPDAILVDPCDSQAIAGQILRLENDPDFYRQQVRYGLERVKLFSWSASARQLLSLYQSI